MSSNNLITIIIIVAVAGLIAGGFIYFGGRGSTISGGLTAVQPSGAVDTNAVSRELLLSLSSLRNLKLDDSFFSDRAFLSLVDYSRDLPPQSVGRDNPFLPVK